jgi:hypothetical protein
MTLKPILMTAVIASLAACGGSSTSNVSFADALSDFEGNALFDEEGDIEFPTVAALAAAGGATYSGETAIYLDADAFDDDFESPSDLPTPSLIGQLALQTAFSGTAGTVTGTMSNFVDSADNAKTGSLTLSDGVIFEDDFVEDDPENGFFALFDGTLSGAGLGSRRYEGVIGGAVAADGEVVGAGVGIPISSLDPATFEEEDLDDFDPEFFMVLIANED